jgi:hypothetical protein
MVLAGSRFVMPPGVVSRDCSVQLWAPAATLFRNALAVTTRRRPVLNATKMSGPIPAEAVLRLSGHGEEYVHGVVGGPFAGRLTAPPFAPLRESRRAGSSELCSTWRSGWCDESAPRVVAMLATQQERLVDRDDGATSWVQQRHAAARSCGHGGNDDDLRCAGVTKSGNSGAQQGAWKDTTR